MFRRRKSVTRDGVKIVLIKTRGLERRFVGANERGGGEVAVPNSACFTYTPNSQITFARIRASPRQFGLINIINGGALIQTFFAGCEHMLPCATNCLAI